MSEDAATVRAAPGENQEARQAEDAWTRGYLAAANDLERPYGVAVFTPLSPDDVRKAVQAMNAVVPNASERLHAAWARHWAANLRSEVPQP